MVGFTSGYGQAHVDGFLEPIYPHCCKSNRADIDIDEDYTSIQLSKMIEELVTYPELAWEDGFQGRVELSFIISQSGYVSGVKTHGPSHHSILNNLVGVVNKSMLESLWTPGMLRGKHISSKVNISLLYTETMRDGPKVLALEISPYIIPPPPPTVCTFDIVQQMPIFPGCSQEPDSQKANNTCTRNGLLHFIEQHRSIFSDPVKKPSVLVIGIIIDTSGYIRDIKLLRGRTPELNREALRLVGLMNIELGPWIPARQHDRVVPMRFNLAIRL